MSTEASGPANLAEPQHRGTLTVDSSVLRKIAEYAASTVPDAGGASRNWIGVRSGVDPDARPTAKVVVNGSTVAVRVTCGVRYPAPLRDTTETVRRHVADNLRTLAGLEVTRVDVEVRWLERVRSSSHVH